jgi:negative regulator of flagellin synthesis FlgM
MDIRTDFQSLQRVSGEASVARNERAAEVAGSTSNPAASADEAHLSSAAKMATQTRSLPDVRAEKVAGVQAALAAGTYNVSSSEVAGKLIDHMLGNRD